MAVQLNPAQKEEIRRLTQLANRRIKNVDKAYAKEGKSVLPKELVANFQIRETWQTKANPLSRSVKFEDEKAYNEHLRMLRSFETSRPGIKEYTQIQRMKTSAAIETALGKDLPPSFAKKLGRMTAPTLADFWNKFSERAARMAASYSSLSAITETIEEFFPEDAAFLLDA